MKVDMQLSGVDGVLDLLQRLPPEVVSKRGGPVKTALRKAARVILKQEQANLRAVTANQSDAAARQSTGLLLGSLVVTRGKEPTGTKGERYLVRVKRKTYQRKSGKPVTTLKTAQLLEYGSSHQPAEPWIRPALMTAGELAIRTAEVELVKGIDRAVKRMAKGKA